MFCLRNEFQNNKHNQIILFHKTFILFLILFVILFPSSKASQDFEFIGRKYLWARNSDSLELKEELTIQVVVRLAETFREQPLIEKYGCTKDQLGGFF